MVKLERNVNIKLSEVLHEELNKIAKENKIKVATLIRYFIDSGIKQLKNGETIEIQEIVSISLKNNK